MKTIAQALPSDTLDTLIEQVAPSDMHTQELVQFRDYLAKLDSKQTKSLHEELKSAARVRGRKIMLREQLLSRLGTDWLRKQQEMVEAELAKIEVAKDTIDFNVLELELSGQTWRLGKMTKVLRLDELAQSDPLVNMIKLQQKEEENDTFGGEASLDEDKLETLFGLK